MYDKSCLLSDLASEWQRGYSWRCFDDFCCVNQVIMLTSLHLSKVTSSFAIIQRPYNWVHKYKWPVAPSGEQFSA